MADIFEKIRRVGRKNKNLRNSVYSVVSCSDLTPGSLEVWVDLPDEIKFDPSLAPFKQLYEQRHGKLEIPEAAHEGDKFIFEKKGEKESDQDNKLYESDVKIGNGTPMLVEPIPDINVKKVLSKQVRQSFRIIKLSVLVFCWGLLTLSLLLHEEQTHKTYHIAVKPGEIKAYQLHDDLESLLVTLTGPFANAKNSSASQLDLWLHKSTGPNLTGEFEQDSTTWTVPLPTELMLEVTPSSTESKRLVLEKHRSGQLADEHSNSLIYEASGSNVSLCIRSTGNTTVPLTLTYKLNPLSERDGVIYAAFLLAILYTLIIFEIVNRTLAALLSSSLSIAVLSVTGCRPSLPELVSWLDVETLLLLFSMMILVAIIAETGLFDYFAVVAFEVTGGKTWPLITCLCFFTALFSTFLDNVTTVLLMTPVTIRLCEVMELNPVPVLMSMVIFSNVGGAATPVGDPPNVIIASHPSVLQANINFTTFTIHMGLGIILVCIQTYLQLRYMFRDMNTLRHCIPKHIQELRQEIFAWKRAAASLSSYSRDEDVVRKALEKKVQRLKVELLKKEAGSGKKNDPKFCSTLAEMKEKYKIRDKPLLVKSSICLIFVVMVFFLHAIPQLQTLSLGWTALLGALLLLLLAEREDLEPILARVEWSTLLFFAALFVLMESLSKLGLISWIGSLTEGLILKVEEESRLLVAIMLMLWVSGLASAFVDNIPLTTMMVRVMAALSDPKGLGLPLAPLAWALSFGACLGGNGTLIGASANVVCAGVAEQHGYRFTFLQYLRIGFPVMIGNLMVASVYLLFSHCVFHWH